MEICDSASGSSCGIFFRSPTMENAEISGTLLQCMGALDVFSYEVLSPSKSSYYFDQVAVCQMEVVIIIIDVIKCVEAPISKRVSSYSMLEKNMKVLKDTLQDLNSKRRDVERQVQAELTVFKMEKEEVKTWEERVDVMNNDVNKIEEKVRGAKCSSRARLGKDVEEKIPEVKQLLQRAMSFTTLVIDRPPPGGLRLPVQQLVGQTRVVDKIWAQLTGSEAGIIGVCGVEGIGKTIIAKHINNKLLKECDTRDSKFRKVIWVPSTHNNQDEFDLVKFQNDIAADLLGVNHDNNQKLLPDDKDKRAGKVTQILEATKGSIVIILDDVRKPFSLLDAGVSEPIACGKCKLLITSRSDEVCKNTGCQVVEMVTPLPKNDALALFLQKSELGHLMAAPAIARTVIEVVEECGGMPSRILSLASELKGVSDVHEWRIKKWTVPKNAPSEQEQKKMMVDYMKRKVAPVAFMKRYDKDRDDRLSNLELKEAFKAMGSKYPGWRAVRALRYADANRDGYIDGDEIHRLIEYVIKYLSKNINQ